jgi:hypothetical protein
MKEMQGIWETRIGHTRERDKELKRKKERERKRERDETWHTGTVVYPPHSPAPLLHPPCNHSSFIKM